MKVICVAAIMVMLGLNASARLWTSKDGTQTVEGELENYQNGMVRLLLPDGKRRMVDARYLSEKDIQFLDSKGSGDIQTVALDSKTEEAKQEAASGGKMFELLKDKVIDKKGDDFDLAKSGVPEYFIFYYSASWCPPCRQFTPELVKDYRRYRNSHPFEVVLYPSDRSASDSEDYMKDYRMPFAGLKYSEVRDEEIPRNPGGGIPALRMVDAGGNTVLTSQDVNRGDFMKEAMKIIKGRE